MFRSEPLLGNLFMIIKLQLKFYNEYRIQVLNDAFKGNDATAKQIDDISCHLTIETNI